jgi:hypothetical protein
LLVAEPKAILSASGLSNANPINDISCAIEYSFSNSEIRIREQD